MQVTVRFSGMFRALAGCAQLATTLPDGSALRDLLRELRGMLSATFIEKAVTPLGSGAGARSLILVNRVHVQEEDALERRLADGDVVAFVPPMAGGR